MKDTVLAIVIPCYNEEEIINITKEKLSEVVNNLIRDEKISDKSYLLFVDDGSQDKTWDIIKNMNTQNPQLIKGLKLSRNFGTQGALYAGLVSCEANAIITIDADLQDDINAIEQMLKKYDNGCDIVYGVRNNRKTDPFIKRFTANVYYKLTEMLGMKLIPNHSDFRLISGKITEELRKTTETNMYIRGIIQSFGFKSDCVYYKREKRIGGKTKYNYWKLTMLALDGITSFSTTPIRLISLFGLICFFIAIIMSLYAIYVYIVNKTISGWPSLFVSLYFIGGMTLLSLGIIGEYIGKIYQETKRRQRYIIEEELL